METRLRTTAIALTAMAALSMTACGSDSNAAGPSAGPAKAGGQNAWAGAAKDAGNGDSITIGTWKGKPNAVKVTCPGEEGAVTAVIQAPEGWTATTTQPKGGGDAGVKIEGQGKSVEIQPHGDAAVTWGVTATFGTGFSMEAEGSDLKFYARSVTCQR